MPPRPIHKWKTFWLGILILVFLTWAWARSRNHDDYIRIRHASTTYAIGSGAGHIGCNSLTVKAHGIISPRRFDCGSIAMKKISPWFPQPTRSVQWDDASSTATHRGIAHWLIILLFLATWITFLLFRYRRLRHLTAYSTEPEPAP